jgi:hypothetical protein
VTPTDQASATAPSPAVLEVDTTYGGIYAGTSFEFSEEVADHFNGAADRAGEVLPGEYVPFQAGEYFSIACPMAASYPREEFVAAYQELRALIDGELEFRFTEHPRLFSNANRDWTQIRAVPTYIRKELVPEGFFGATHRVEVFQGERLLFGPVERFFHTATSGCLFSHIEDAPGKLVVEVGGNLEALARTGMVVLFTDPAFGEPLGAAQVHEDRAIVPLPYTLLGKDHVGDLMLFNEGLVRGLSARGPRVVLEVYFGQRGTGLAAALYSGHTRDTALRTDATVL